MNLSTFSLQRSSGPLSLPDRLRAGLVEARGPEGPEAWLREIEAAVSRLELVWRVSFDSILASSWSSLLLAGTTVSGQDLVLKLPATRDQGAREEAAYRVLAGYGLVPALFDFDSASGALLLERVDANPATARLDVNLVAKSLRRLSEVDVALLDPSLVYRLASLEENLRTRAGWAESRARSGLRPGRSSSSVDAALSRGLELVSSASDVGLVHGDFQPKNLLVRSFSAWWLIDPMAAVGDRCFDAALWSLRSSAHPTQPASLLASKLDLDLDRVLAWVEVLSELSWDVRQEVSGVLPVL